MAEYHADLGRNTREYATVFIAAETADDAARRLRDALAADKAGEYPELFADLRWKAGDCEPMDLIDGLIDTARDCYAEYDETIDIEGPKPPTVAEVLREVAALLEKAAAFHPSSPLAAGMKLAALRCRQALGEVAPDGA